MEDAASSVPWPLWITIGLAVVGAVWGVAAWVTKVNEARKGWRDVATEIRKDIKQIFLRLPPPQTTGSGSPVQLTEFGEKVAAKLEASAWATERAPHLWQKVEGFKPFEVDEFCENYVQNNLDTATRERVAQRAYEFGIKREHVLNVLRVVLREALFDLCPICGLGERYAKTGDREDYRCPQHGRFRISGSVLASALWQGSTREEKEKILKDADPDKDGILHIMSYSLPNAE